MRGYPIRERVIGQLVADKADLHGDRVFLQFENRKFSYGDMDRLSNRIANGLAGLGVSKGMHVALMLDNKPEIILLYFALGKLGAVAVPVNTAAKGELLSYYLNQSDSQLAVVDIALMPRLVAVLAATPKLRRVVAIAEDGSTTGVAGQGLPVPAHEFQTLLAAPDTRPEADVRFCDLHSILYTSGTTGPSKGNMSTHCHALTCGFELAKTYGYSADDAVYLCLPLFHGNAWLCSVMPALVSDATLAVSKRFSASTIWDDLRRTGATQFNSLGAMTNFIWSPPPMRATATTRCVRSWWCRRRANSTRTSRSGSASSSPPSMR